MLLQNCSVYRVKCPTHWLRMNEYGALVELNWQDTTAELGEKSIQLSLCTPQIVHWLPLDRTRVSAVRDRRLTAWAVAGPTYWEEMHRFTSKQKYKILGIKDSVLQFQYWTQLRSITVNYTLLHCISLRQIYICPDKIRVTMILSLKICIWIAFSTTSSAFPTHCNLSS